MVDKSEKFSWLVRLGYAARGLVYMLIGYLALSSAGGDKGPQGAFSYLQDVPLGQPILYLVTIGLIAYALYKFCSALLDVEKRGSDGKGIMVRVGEAASGIAYSVLAYTALEFAKGDKQRGTGADGAQQAAGSILSAGIGPLLLGIVGLGFLAGAALQAKAAVTGSLMDRVSARAPGFVEYLGRGGFAARALVFLIIGWSLVKSAWFSSSTQVKTLGEAVTSLSDNGTLYTAVAIGLILFGLFSLFVARYRIIPDLNQRRLGLRRR
jgi:hypothetical protein